METMVVCDLRTVSFDIPKQEILTCDSVTVAVDAVVFYRYMKTSLYELFLSAI
jgi:regulator of protease activity HflC (stomatin/prohibitin superfamily)